jgi:hypothetical protein
VQLEQCCTERAVHSGILRLKRDGALNVLQRLDAASGVESQHAEPQMRKVQLGAKVKREDKAVCGVFKFSSLMVDLAKQTVCLGDVMAKGEAPLQELLSRDGISLLQAFQGLTVEIARACAVLDPQRGHRNRGSGPIGGVARLQ